LSRFLKFVRASGELTVSSQPSPYGSLFSAAASRARFGLMSMI